MRKNNTFQRNRSSGYGGKMNSERTAGFLAAQEFSYETGISELMESGLQIYPERSPN